MLNDDILIAQSSLWANLKLEGKSISNGTGILSFKAPYKCYDINNNKVAEINMWKRVDLGSLNWYFASPTWYAILDQPKSFFNGSFSHKYTFTNESRSSMGNMYGTSNGGGGSAIWIRDDSLNSKTEQEVKQAMSGVYLYYETATPTELYGINLLANTYENINGRSNVVLGAVDLGTLNWTYDGVVGRFYTRSLSDFKRNGSWNVPNENAICSKLTIVSFSQINSEDTQEALNMSYTDDNLIKARSGNYTDATTFKQVMSGVILIYELATPRTDYYLSRMIPKNVVKIIDDNGMEVEV